MEGDALQALENSLFNNPDPNHLKEIEDITDIQVLENPGNQQYDYVFKVITIGDPSKNHTHAQFHFRQREVEYAQAADGEQIP